MKILFLLSLVASALAFSCKDQNNKDVDWFAVYKMPKLTDSSIAGVKDGYGFYYLDVNAKSKLVASVNDLQSKNQAIAYTLQQWYDVQKDTSIFHVMYNDEPYGTKSTIMEALLKNNTILPENRVEYGHTKGTVFFNAQTGVWLIHSVPKFPNPTTYEYPVSGTDYGQTMLCITFKYSELSNIGTQLYYNHPDIYSSQLPTAMASANPDLANVIGGTFKKGTPYTSTIDLTSAAGIRFRSFAKNADFNQDLYDGLVASGIKTDIQVESWRRGDEVPLDCAASYKVADALNIKVGQSMEFKYTKDHSKLARSTKSTVPYVCIGDVNRMTSQYVRGGGTVCLNDPFVWQAFDVVTAEKQECT